MIYPVRSRVVSLGGLGNQAVIELAAQMDPKVRAANTQAQKDAEADAKQDAERMEKAVKKAAIETAVAQAGVTMALNAIPVVGSIVSAIAGAVLGDMAKRYGEKLKKYGESRTKWLERYIGQRQEEMNNALNAAYQTAYKKAIPLAISFQPLEFTVSERDEIVNKDTYGGAFSGIGLYKKLTGKEMYEKGKREIDAMINKGKAQIDGIVNPMIAKVKQPGFVALLAKQIAVQTRNNPQFLAICRQIGAPPPSRYLGDGEPGPGASGSTPIPRLQTSGVQSGNGMGTTLRSEGAKALPSTADRPVFFQPDTVDDAMRPANKIRTVGFIAAAAVGAWLLFR